MYDTTSLVGVEENFTLVTLAMSRNYKTNKTPKNRTKKVDIHRNGLKFTHDFSHHRGTIFLNSKFRGLF